MGIINLKFQISPTCRAARNLKIILALILLFVPASVQTQGILNEDVKGKVLGASVARSQKDKSSRMPVESYFGESGYFTTKDQLAALGVAVYPEDIVTYFPDPSLGLGSIIRVTRATPVTVKDGKKEYLYRTWAESVDRLLSERSIELAGEDLVNPGLSSALEPDMRIVITRVQIAKVTQKEPIDFKIVKKDDPNLDKGKTKITQAGKKGERTKLFEVRRENGEEVARKLIEDNVTKEPVEEIMLVGTKPVITVACRFEETVLKATQKYGVDANEFCTRMMKESRGNPNSDGGRYKGLFQYEEGFWASASAKAGYAGASIWDAEAQIYTTAWAWSHGLRGRWPK